MAKKKNQRRDSQSSSKDDSAHEQDEGNAEQAGPPPKSSPKGSLTLNGTPKASAAEHQHPAAAENKTADTKHKRDKAGGEDSSKKQQPEKAPALSSKNKDNQQNSKSNKDSKSNGHNPVQKIKGKAKDTRRRLEKRRYILVLGVLAGCGLMALLVRLGFMDFIIEHEAVQSVITGVETTMRPMTDFLEGLELDSKAQDLLAKVMPELDNYKPSISLWPSEGDRPGLQAKACGLKPKHPVIMLPGFTSTGLEIWEGRECAKQYFRQRIWGTSRMLHQFMLNKDCWVQHISLDNSTGMDPEGVKLRAATGLEAADYVIGGYYVWAKIIENLADIGYTSNEMYMAAFDWRLSPHLLQKRDFYFDKLRAQIELAYHTNHKTPVFMVAHSYATQVAMWFLKWVESEKGANAGKDWTAKHVAGMVNVAGPMFGVPKAGAALLSGEMKDTASLGRLSGVLDMYLSATARARLFRSWSSLVTMLPYGGNFVWGNLTWAPDDVAVKANTTDNVAGKAKDPQPPPLEETAEKHGLDLSDANERGESVDGIPSSGQMFSFASTADVSGDKHAEDKDSPGASRHKNMTWEQTWTDLVRPKMTLDELDDWIDIQTNAADVKDLATNPKYDHPKYWNNPLTYALPDAPDFKMWCFYGVGKKAERGYLYQDSPESLAKHKQKGSTGRRSEENSSRSCSEESDACESDNEDDEVPYTINNAASNAPFEMGVRFTDGDGTVPLMSLGYMCYEGWQNPRYPFNPANISVTIIEHRHQDSSSLLGDPRGAKTSGDHVDIMGNDALIRNIIWVVAGRADNVTGNITSKIDEISSRLDLLAHV